MILGGMTAESGTPNTQVTRKYKESMHVLDIRVSQVRPVNESPQSHTNVELAASPKQLPSLRHGLDEQGSMSAVLINTSLGILTNVFNNITHCAICYMTCTNIISYSNNAHFIHHWLAKVVTTLSHSCYKVITTL